MTDNKSQISALGLYERMGWRWFRYHAYQRMYLLRFFLVAYVAAIGLAFTAVDRALYYAGAALGVTSCLICLVGWLSDVRSRRLIEIGENLLEEVFSSVGAPGTLNPIARARHKTGGGVRYKIAILWIYCLGGVVSFFIALSCLMKITGLGGSWIDVIRGVTGGV